MILHLPSMSVCLLLFWRQAPPCPVPAQCWPSAGPVLAQCWLTQRPVLTKVFVEAVLLHQRRQVGLALGLQPHQGGAHIVRHNLVLRVGQVQLCGQTGAGRRRCTRWMRCADARRAGTDADRHPAPS